MVPSGVLKVEQNKNFKRQLIGIAQIAGRNLQTEGHLVKKVYSITDNNTIMDKSISTMCDIFHQSVVIMINLFYIR